MRSAHPPFCGWGCLIAMLPRDKQEEKSGPRIALSEMLLARLAMPVSDNAILRQLKRHVRERADLAPLGAIAIDDLERRTVADVLETRSAKETADWLERRPEIEIVSRDRCGLYAQGIRQGAPQARQVARYLSFGCRRISRGRPRPRTQPSVSPVSMPFVAAVSAALAKNERRRCTKAASRIVTRNLYEAEREHVRGLREASQYKRSSRLRKKGRDVFRASQTQSGLPQAALTWVERRARRVPARRRPKFVKTRPLPRPGPPEGTASLRFA